MIKLLINKFKILFLIIIYGLLFSSCSTVQEAFDPEKNNSEEFLIEKKSPLSMPPDFDKLPEPDLENTEKNLDNNSVKKLIVTDQESQSPNDVVSDLETSVIEKIKNN